MVDVHLFVCARARSSLRDAGDAVARDLFVGLQGLFEIGGLVWKSVGWSIKRRDAWMGVLK